MEYFKITKSGQKEYPYKLTITDKDAKEILKEYYHYAMFSWVFKTKEEAEAEAYKDVERINKIKDIQKTICNTY